MPIKGCQIKGKKGYKWGDHGKCYKTKKRAVKQGGAISISKIKAKDFNEKHWGKPRWE